jgi:hypothetical protein
MLDTEWPRVRAAMETWFEADPGTVSLASLTAD